MNYGHLVSPSDDPKKWPRCPKCGKKHRILKILDSQQKDLLCFECLEAVKLK